MAVRSNKLAPMSLFIFRERGREGEVGEKHRCVVVSCTSLTGDLACNPGMCPDWEPNQRPFGLQSGAKSTEPHQPGQLLCLLTYDSSSHFTCTITSSLFGIIDVPGSFSDCPAPALESTIPPRRPSSLYRRMVFRNQYLSTRYAHCYWGVFAFRSYLYVHSHTHLSVVPHTPVHIKTSRS